MIDGIPACAGRADLFDAAMHSLAKLATARTICDRCPIRQDCHTDGTRNRLTGVYGGVLLAGGRPTTQPLPRRTPQTWGDIRGCSVDGCDRHHQAKGLCDMHYKAHRRNTAGECTADGCDNPVHGRGLCIGHMFKQRRADAPTCTIDGCDNPQKTRGWCGRHYRAWQQHGDPVAFDNRTCNCGEPLPTRNRSGKCVRCRKREQSARYDRYKRQRRKQEGAT